MNFTTLQARLALNAGNLQSSHPVYSSLGQYVNDGLRLMIALATQRFQNFELFPELNDYDWTDVTIADQDFLALNADTYAVQNVYSLDSSVSPTISNAQWRLLGFLTPQAFDQLSRPTTQIAFPTNWTTRKGQIEFWPTPRATKTTYVKYDGIRDEADLSAGGDLPRAHKRWHPAILDCASHLIWNDLGDYERATQFFDAAEKKVGLVGAAIVGLRQANTLRTLSVSGTPRRFA